VFGDEAFDGHEAVIFGFDRASGLRAIIAIHRVREGRAVGGCRTRAYGSDHEALRDVLRLSRGMSYKAALAGLPCGGAKAVIIGEPGRVKTHEALRAMGRLIASLGGRYVTAEDVGTGQEDLAIMKEETPWVLGADATGGPGAPFTALGVLYAMSATVAHVTGSDRLDGLTVAVQGVGKVGRRLCALLSDRGARLVIADPDAVAAAEAAAETGATVVAPETIYGSEADVFAPCGVGGVLNRTTIDELRCRMVVGAANNQLEDAVAGLELHRRGIVYVPDYVASAGGIINGLQELDGYDRSRVERKCADIFDTTIMVLDEARTTGVAASVAGDRLAQRLLDEEPRPNSIPS
jgi:leucine dehydrogenase